MEHRSGDPALPGVPSSGGARPGRLLKTAASTVGGLLRGNGPSIFPFVPSDDPHLLREDPARLAHFGRWFVRMRWLACVVAGVLIVVTVEALDYLERDAFWPLAATLACLVLANVAFTVLLRRGYVRSPMLESQIYADLVILTSLLHFSGGIENPLCFAYLFHIIIGGILLEKRKCYTIVVVASGLFTVLAVAELTGLVEHYTLLAFPHVEEAGELAHAAHQPIYVASRVFVQIVVMTLTAYFTTVIMERLRVEEHRALADRQRLERVVQAAGAGLAILDRELRPTWLNEQMITWSGLSADDKGNRGTQLDEWIGGADGPAAQTLEDGRSRVVERQLVDPGEGTRALEITVAPLMDEAGNVFQVVGLAQDVTQRKMFEAEMMHSGKMAALGLMAAGVAHEVGNPLASISTRLRLMEQRHDEPFLVDSVRLLQGQIDRIGRIVQGVSQFGRPTKEGWTVCEINQLVAEALQVLRLHRPAKPIEIRTDLADGIPETIAVRDQVIQVLVNLGLNALEAMGQRGVLTVKTAVDRGDVHVSLADTGPGIDEHSRARIFDPFFSTREKGSGLGLFIAHTIVSAHGGRIEVESGRERGTVFTVILPIRSVDKQRGGAPEE